jgi:conjugative transfer signal peptidase TraF
VKRAVTRILLGWLLALALAMIAGEAGIRLNTSASVPRGFYWLSSEAPEHGSYVAVCPPRVPIFELARDRGYFGRGRCAGGYSELIKVLAAGPGDRVRIDVSGVRVGRRSWPSSAPKTVDAAGRSLPQLAALDATLGSTSVLVMSQDCASGFDARYFGPLSRSTIVGTAVPLLTW